MLSTLLACRDKKCTEPRIEAYIRCTCTNYMPQDMGRKSNECAHRKCGVAVYMSMTVESAPLSVVRIS
jgi:hypothetical protein